LQVLLLIVLVSCTHVLIHEVNATKFHALELGDGAETGKESDIS
jgi:hypothetical protein